jgi:iron-sulfur cluster repair protein YtfE (RIC family)
MRFAVDAWCSRHPSFQRDPTGRGSAIPGLGPWTWRSILGTPKEHGWPLPLRDHEMTAMRNEIYELTPPALVLLAPVSGPQDNMSLGAPPPEVRLRRGPRLSSTLFTPECHRDALIAAYPELRPVCDRLRFGPHRGLVHWCTDMESALLVLARSAKPPPASPTCDWSQAELFELIDDLVDHHHGPLRNELQRLEILLHSIVDRLTDASIADFERSFARLKSHLVTHLDTEEAEVFPKCLAIETASRGHPDEEPKRIDVTTGIRAMMVGHDDASAEFAEVLVLSGMCAQGNADPDLELMRMGLLAMQADYLVRATKESEILVPAAIFAEEQLHAWTDAAASADGPDPATSVENPNVR